MTISEPVIPWKLELENCVGIIPIALSKHITCLASLLFQKLLFPLPYHRTYLYGHGRPSGPQDRWKISCPDHLHGNITALMKTLVLKVAIKQHRRSAIHGPFFLGNLTADSDEDLWQEPTLESSLEVAPPHSFIYTFPSTQGVLTLIGVLC